MGNYEKPQLLTEDTDEEICVDVHSSGIGLVVVGTIVLSMVWPPIEVE
ncbi:MAG: hypothetical protein HFH80_06105 [Lachnospiraceae bacterium]|nr:hypothetical protein [Lachnospiraceae bacterium]